MPKHHLVKLTIKNQTQYRLTDPLTTFNSGRVGDGWKFIDISPNKSETIEMYEKDQSTMTGLSMYVTYQFCGATLGIACSNPYWGTNNKLNADKIAKKAYDDMTGTPFHSKVINYGDTVFTVSGNITQGNTGEAIIIIKEI